MAIDTLTLLRALRHQSHERGSNAQTVNDAHQWGHINGACTALLDIHQLDVDIPHHAATKFAKLALTVGGLSELAQFVDKVGGEKAAIAVASEPWVLDEYGTSAWIHLQFLQAGRRDVQVVEKPTPNGHVPDDVARTAIKRTTRKRKEQS